MFRYLDRLFDCRDLYPFEKTILENVVTRMDDQTSSRLQSQIRVINKVQRICDGREVNLYQMRYGKAVFDDHLRFPNAPAELLLASVSLRMPTREAKLSAKVWMAEGRLFSLEFNISPQQFFTGINLRDARPEIVDVKIFCDRL